MEMGIQRDALPQGIYYRIQKRYIYPSFFMRL